MVYRILSIDGGGIRGVIAATLLQHIEDDYLKPKSSSLYDHFNMFAGTSTGSIIAAALASRKTAEEVVKLYEVRGQTIFPYNSRWSPARIGLVLQYGASAPKYSDAGLSKVLKKELGGDTYKLKQVKDGDKRLLITAYDTVGREKFTFDSEETTLHSTPLWQAALCSSSAPTFFPAQPFEYQGKELSLIDGGVVANNPTILAIAQAIASGISLEEIQVLSVGTGDPTRSIPYSAAREWGALEWALPIVDVLFDGAADVNHFIAQQLLKKHYLRLQFKLNSDDFEAVGRLSDDIDDATPENIKSLQKAGHEFYRLNKHQIGSVPVLT